MPPGQVSKKVATACDRRHRARDGRGAVRREIMRSFIRIVGGTLGILVGLVGVVSVGLTESKRPRVTGEWVGTWGISAPPKAGEAQTQSRYSGKDLQLDCNVKELSGGAWEATFAGECGRPYKYTVKMQGRQVGEVVLFQGTADLGEKDGGIYDWIGRANEEEFIGFFTSQKYTGHFRLARKP
jgi:hypothetical protein